MEALAACAHLMLFSSYMDSQDFPLSEYLSRIGLDTAPKPDLEGLRALHAAQAFSIPFENFDVLLGRNISLETGDLVSKLIRHRRGGYCFELNGIFYRALKALGFEVRQLMARVLYDRPDPGARTHEVLLVRISGEDWLADNGFGGPGLCLPLPMMPDVIGEQFGERYRLRGDPQLGMVLQRESKGAFIDIFSFNENEVTLDVDIEMANHFTSTWPASTFRLRRMCSLRKAWGRVTLSDMELTIHRDGESVSRTLRPGPGYIAAMAEHFGIYLDAAYEDLAPLGPQP